MKEKSFQLFNFSKEKSILENIKRDFYEKLINQYGFYMDRYNSEYDARDNYIAIKQVEDGIYVVLITDDENQNIDIEEGIKYLRTTKKVFSLNVILMSLNNINENNRTDINKMIINVKNRKVVYCDKSCSPLMKIFNNMNSSTNSKNVYNGLTGFKRNFITYSLIIINVMIFIITAFLSNSIFDIKGSVLLVFGAKYGPLIKAGEYYRLFTCAFLHGGIIHILFNMYSLYIVGPQINRVYGMYKYIFIYIITCFTSSIASYTFSPNTLSIGASGAIFGLLGALISFGIIERRKMDKRFLSGLLQVLALNLFIGFTNRSIDNYGHIGGLIGGIIIGFILYSLGKYHNDKCKNY
eukprot:TRINITY_DN12471_c0_g1_i1.p1 TRINITY_DN12471_c0_g1~~TRINITY_DN12471_c0_g1_i1.p1  ORF type:complete len:352 (-),score=19.27 TRINITY_DN12471_c0_g1_i1:214-1269(-)